MSFSLCSTTLGNTGAILCDVSPGIPKKISVWNGSKALTAIAGSLFQPFLEASSKKSKLDSDKLFVFPTIEDVADKSESNKEGSLNQGFKTILVEGKPGYEFKVFAGASLVPQLRKFNNQTVRVLTLDVNSRVWGTKSGANFVGAQAKIFVTGLKFATGQNVEEGVVTISVIYLDSAELNDDATFGEVDSFSGVVGLLDVQLSEYAVHAANVFKLQALIPTAEIGESINVYDSFATPLETAGTILAHTGATFSTSLAVTSITKNVANKGWDVTVEATAYGLLAASAPIRFSLANPTVLDAADVTGIEGLPVTAIK